MLAKVGVVRWAGDLSFSTFAGAFTESTRDWDYAWGLGAQARFGKLAMRLEYEHYETIQGISGMDPPDIVSLGVVWTF